MRTLSNGAKMPETGDRGADIFDALEDNIQLQNDHTHNGSDGEPISTQYLSKGTTTIEAADWVAVASQTGTYQQTVTIAAGYDVDTAEMKFYINNGGAGIAGQLIHPRVEKVTDTTYKVYINDNTLELTAVYG